MPKIFPRIPGGGSGSPAPQPQPSEVPEPEGKTLQEKIASATGIIANLFRRAGELTSQLAAVESERERLETETIAAQKAVEEERALHAKSKTDLIAANAAVPVLTAERDSAIGRIETLE